MADDIFTLDDNNNAAVRTVGVKAGASETNSPIIFTTDENGNAAVRVVGAGGDQHNLGWYATPEALEEAHPTAEAGDFAVVGSTDTVWIWDTDTSAWKNTAVAGQVTSVNGQTGAVTLTASDVGALPDNTHIPVDPVQADWDETDSAALDYIKNKPTIPAAQVNSDWNASSGVAQILNKPSLAAVATSGSYSDLTNTPTIPAAQVNSDWNANSGVAEILNKPTLGTAASADTTDFATAAQGALAATAVQPSDLATVATTGSYNDLSNKPTIPAAQVNSDWDANSGVAQILNKPTLGTMASESASDYTPTSGLATVATTGAYSDLSGTPTIPEAIQVSTMPTAAAGEVGKVYQFIGTTDANYTHGYFYECVSDGQDPATYSWSQLDVQPSSGGGGLPDQTGNAGKFLITDGTDASWGDSITSLKVVNSSDNTKYTSLTSACNIIAWEGNNFYRMQLINDIGARCLIIVDSVTDKKTAIGARNKKIDYIHAYYLNGSTSSYYNNYNIEIPSIGGKLALQIDTMPTAASLYVGTIYQFTGTTDSTYTNGHFYKCVSDGQNPATYSWEEVQLGGGAGGSTSATATLTVADWSSNTQTVNVTGVTASNIVFVSPAPASASDYAAAGIVCTAQSTNSLTFSCQTVPSNAIIVNVVILG